MSCTACEATKRALTERVEALEAFARTVAGSFGATASAKGNGAPYPPTWPQPGPEERGGARPAAFRLGVRAAIEGMPRTACPYRSSSRGHDNSWRRGWDAGDRFVRSTSK